MHLPSVIRYSASLLFAIAAMPAWAGERPANALAGKVAEFGREPSGLIVGAANGEVSEEGEIARLEKIPPQPIPIQDDSLAGAINTIANVAGMNYIAPTLDEFPERVTLTANTNPLRLLDMLGARYRFSRSFDARSGMWTFARERVGALVTRTYYFKYANLDTYKSSQNSFTELGGTTSLDSGSSSGGSSGGLVFTPQTQKIIDDLRDQLGLPANAVATDKGGKEGAPRPRVEGKAAETSAAKIIYLPNSKALKVTCTVDQHKIVEDYVATVDQAPVQLTIEARFFETTHNPSTVLGIDPSNFQPKVTLDNLTTSLRQAGSIGDRATLSVDALSLQLNALATDNRSKMINNPRVTTVDNTEVYFSVGDEEPFVAANTINAGAVDAGFGSSQARIAIRRIGTSVNLVPTYFPGDPAKGEKARIRMVVRIEVGSLKAFRAIGSVNVPVVASQKYEYTVYVDEGEALAFGGLAGIGESSDIKKVPLAGDIPVVGYIFKSKNTTVTQRNLIAYITARVLDPKAKVVMPALKLEPEKPASIPAATPEAKPDGTPTAATPGNPPAAVKPKRSFGDIFRRGT